MKELLKRCPHHQISKWQILQRSYDGLFDSLKQTLDSSYGGSLMLKNEVEAWMLFYTLSENSLLNLGLYSLWQSERKGVLDVGLNIHLRGQIDALTRKVGQLLLTHGNSSARSVSNICFNSGHDT